MCAGGSRTVDPLGRLLVTSEVTYEPVISRRVNLDYAVIHLDYNGSALPRLKEKYGAGAQIDVARPEAVACLYSEAEGVSVDEMIAEFGLERRTDYFARTNRVREATLVAARTEDQIEEVADLTARVERREAMAAGAAGAA